MLRETSKSRKCRVRIPCLFPNAACNQCASAPGCLTPCSMAQLPLKRHRHPLSGGRRSAWHRTGHRQHMGGLRLHGTAVRGLDDAHLARVRHVDLGRGVLRALPRTAHGAGRPDRRVERVRERRNQRRTVGRRGSRPERTRGPLSHAGTRQSVNPPAQCPAARFPRVMASNAAKSIYLGPRSAAVALWDISVDVQITVTSDRPSIRPTVFLSGGVSSITKRRSRRSPQSLCRSPQVPGDPPTTSSFRRPAAVIAATISSTARRLRCGVGSRNISLYRSSAGQSRMIGAELPVSWSR